MDPISLAVVTSAVTSLATEVGKGMASEAGKSAWGKIKSWLNWSADPAEADLSADDSGLSSCGKLREGKADYAESCPAVLP